MKFSTSVPLLLAALSSAAPIDDNANVADDVPASVLKGIYVKDIKYNGSGCPPNSVISTFTDDRKTFTLLFSNYVTNIGPGVQFSDRRRNCQLNLKINYPSGFQYSVAQFIMRGYADIQAGVKADIGATYYFSGQSQQTASRNTINGPYSGGYKQEDKVNVASTVWSPCGEEGLANINTDIRLTSSNNQAGGSLTVDSIDGKFVPQIEYKLDWRSCRQGNDATPVDNSSPYQNDPNAPYQNNGPPSQDFKLADSAFSLGN